MRKEVMETIAGIEIFPIISLIIFGGFFLIMLWWVINLDKTYVNKASKLPLDEEENLVSGSNSQNMLKRDAQNVE